MLSKKIEKGLNEQIGLEAYSSSYYMAIATWCAANGYNGIAKYLYHHSDEEREHMLKIYSYMNEAGAQAITPKIDKPPAEQKSVRAGIQAALKHEMKVTASINSLADVSMKEKDYTTFNFLQWFIKEQLEEENQFRSILSKIDLVGTDSKGLYMIDKEMGKKVDNS
ncbi:MAG: ferritin [Bacteroidetes bacterium]|nr:ferritin [Bacteroidota bacterium]